jgi:tRNA-dihydrouridine synthase 3
MCDLNVIQYPCPISKTYLQEIQPIGDGEKPKGAAAESESVASIGLECVPKADGSPRLDPVVIENFLKRTGDTSSQVDTPDVPARFPEKKRLMWDGKTCLYHFKQWTPVFC